MAVFPFANSPVDKEARAITLRAITDLIPDGERVLAAVSGGADSLALLRLLRESGREVLVAHIDHGLRGAQSDADAQSVADLCQSLSVQWVTRRVEAITRPQVSLEMAARQARYDALLAIARENGCRRIATGHTASDQLETVLLHWLRGATVSGWAGMRPSRPLNEVNCGDSKEHNDGKVLLVRPLLNLTRGETEALCREIGWTWREDASNSDPRFARNRVRHELVPLLANLMNSAETSSAAPRPCPTNSSPRQDLARQQLERQTQRAAAIWRDDLEALDELARSHLREISLRCDAELLILDGLAWRLLPRAMQRRILRAGAARFGEQEISLAKIEAARSHIEADGRRIVWQWTRDLRVEWTGAASGNRIRFRVVRLKPQRRAGQSEAAAALL